jgi:hypothetical protein
MAEIFSLFEYYQLTKQPNVMICYRGPVSDIILREISKDIRTKFSYDVQASRKIFAIYMELAQNILYYSSEKIHLSHRQDSIGTILLTQNSEHYIFSCGNLVENQYVQDMLDDCKLINSLDREALREHKREQRNSPRKARSKGAGIGLIQVALTSRLPLQMEHRQIDDTHSFLSITVRVQKESSDEND